MIYISKDRQIHVVWSIFRGTSDVHEDFSRALVKVFLIGNYEKYLLEAVAEGGNLVFDIPQGFPEGAYSLEAIWVKNYNNLLPCSDTLTPSVDSGCRNQPLRWPFKHPHDHRFNDRCIMRSRKDFVFALTEYDSESTFYKDSGEAEIKIQSAVATYGYDGLSAYEIAVLRGDFNGTEGEYLDSLKFKLEVAQEHKLGGITAVTKTDDETEEVKVDPETGRLYVKPGGGSLSVATETKLGGIKAATKTSLETQEVKIDPVTGKLYTLPGGEGGVEIVNNPDEEDLHSVEQSADVHVLQFADKEYNASAFSGLGRVYLRKNISGGKNVLTQAMMSKANTRYIIQYDYDLNEETITIPEGCVLQFEGGSFTNGTINGNNSKIESLSAKIFDKTIILKNFDYVKSEWIGIFPNIDCSEEFEHFIQFGLKILFSEGTYRFTISNLLLSKFTELVGEKSNESVIFVLTPKSEYEYLIGVNYFCTVKDIKIVYSNVEGIEKGIILLVSNKFNPGLEGNVESYYKYDIDNVKIDGVHRDDGDYSEDGITGFAVKCNQYDIDGTIINSKSISWIPRVNRLKVRFAKIGVLIQTIQDSGQEYWCNSLLFTNIDINALYGFYFDRENPSSTGWTIINNYLFQSTNRENSFGLYGYFIEERISNYLSWDNMYLGSGRGNLYMDATSLQRTFWKYSENTVNGFFPYKGSYYPTINKCATNILYYPTDTYNPSNGIPVHTLDYSNENSRIWKLNNSSNTRNIREEFTEISSGLITYSNQLKNRFSGIVFESIKTDNTTDKTPKEYSIALNTTNNRRYIYDFKYVPSYLASSLKLYEDYGFITQTFEKIIDLNYKYKITISFSSESDISTYHLYIKNISFLGVVVTKANIDTENRRLTMIVTPNKTYNAEAIIFVITYRLLPLSLSDERTLLDIDIQLNVNYERLNLFKGTTTQRPNSNLESGDTYFNTDTLIEETYNGTKWVNPDGYVVGLRKGTTYSRPTLSNTDDGYEYYDTNLKKKILWNGTEWVNVDGTALE